MKRELIDYFWRVIMEHNSNDHITVAFFLLQNDAIAWATKENEEEDRAIYSVVKPKKP